MMEKNWIFLFYLDANTGTPTNECPSFGYGVCEGATGKETSTTDFCTQKGYWQYNILTYVVSQRHKKDYIFDEIRTKEFVNLFAQQEGIGKIFIESHLKARMNLTSDKIRFHGCQAVRHDDHLHVQLK